MTLIAFRDKTRRKGIVSCRCAVDERMDVRKTWAWETRKSQGPYGMKLVNKANSPGCAQ